MLVRPLSRKEVVGLCVVALVFALFIAAAVVVSLLGWQIRRDMQYRPIRVALLVTVWLLAVGLGIRKYAKHSDARVSG